MKDGIPLIYWTFRTAWTALHFLVVAAAVTMLLSWSLTNGNAERVLGSAIDDLLDLQAQIASAVPYPWP